MIRRAALVAFLSLATGTPLEARSPERYDAFVLAFNVGLGSGAVRTVETDETRESGIAANMRIGYRFSPKLILSTEITGWSGDVDNIDFYLLTVALAATYLPSGRGLFFRAGGGFGAAKAEVPVGATSTILEEAGPGAILAAGYELRAWERFGYGPELQYGWMNAGEGTKADYAILTLSFNWYP